MCRPPRSSLLRWAIASALTPYFSNWWSLYLPCALARHRVDRREVVTALSLLLSLCLFSFLAKLGFNGVVTDEGCALGFIARDGDMHGWPDSEISAKVGGGGGLVRPVSANPRSCGRCREDHDTFCWGRNDWQGDPTWHGVHVSARGTGPTGSGPVSARVSKDTSNAAHMVEIRPSAWMQCGSGKRRWAKDGRNRPR
jgi:hypothetical protein